MTAATADTIRPSDALELVALIMERWASLKLNREQQIRYAEDLAGLDSGSARAAVDALHRTERQWAPTAGEVRREAARLELGAPDWAEVKRSLIERSRALDVFEPPPWVCPYGECDGDGYAPHAEKERTLTDCRCRPERMASRRLAESLDPLVREFIDEGYVTWFEVDKLGQGRADHDTLTLEAQMRGKWAAFAGRAVESRAIASIEGAADLPRLRQAEDEDAPRRRPPSRSQLHGFDAAAALPRGDGERAA